MEAQLTELLREMEHQSQIHGGVPQIAREAGQFLNLLARSIHAIHLLEVGTSDGYSTLWLADAAEETRGEVITIEHDVWQLEMAQSTFARSPLGERIQLMSGDALELLPMLEGPFDFVLLDGEKAQTLHYLHMIFEQIHSGAVICCDKAISKAPDLADYLAYVHERPGLESLLVPIGEGIEVTYKMP